LVCVHLLNFVFFTKTRRYCINQKEFVVIASEGVQNIPKCGRKWDQSCLLISKLVLNVLVAFWFPLGIITFQNLVAANLKKTPIIHIYLKNISYPTKNDLEGHSLLYLSWVGMFMSRKGLPAGGEESLVEGITSISMGTNATCSCKLSTWDQMESTSSYCCLMQACSMLTENI